MIVRGMLRTEAVEVLARHRGEMLSVVTMQAVEPWNALGQADSRNYNAVGCMGSAASVGLGLALARPEQRVLVVDGDGSLLMQLGGLVSIADAAPPNFVHVVMSNGIYETSGGQSVPGREVADLCGVALASGYREAAAFDSVDTLAELLPRYLAARGPVFVSIAVNGPGSVTNRSVPDVGTKPMQIDAMRRALLS